jgi:RNA methyltransferase, TrmH family
MTADRPIITSTANERIKAVVRLRDRGHRTETGLTIVDGAREITQALDGDVAVSEGFVCPELVLTPAAEAAAARLRAATDVTDVSAPVMAKLAFGDRSDGVVAVIRTPSTDLAALELPENSLVVVVESVEKPGNLGAVLRTADGAGADAVIAANPLTDLFNPNAIRASLGTIFRMPVAAGSSDSVLGWLLARGIRPVAARVDATTPYTKADLRGPLAIVLGSEALGLSEAWDIDGVTPVTIPMRGAADSLNVSVAAAILLYEAVRQRE